MKRLWPHDMKNHDAIQSLLKEALILKEMATDSCSK